MIELGAPGAVPPSAGALGGLPGRSPCSDRQEVHRALAEATDPEPIPIAAHGIGRKRRPGPTRRSPTSSNARPTAPRRRGGVAAAAAFLERAAELTPDPARAGRAALAAAQAKLEARAPRGRAELLATAELGPLDELQRARLQRLRAQIAFAFTRGSDAPPLLARRRQTARSARSRAGARDLPRGARSGDVRRTPRRRPGVQRGGRGGPSRARGAAAAAIDRSPPRRPGDAVHGGLPGAACRRSGSRSRRSGRGARWSRDDHALALAGLSSSRRSDLVGRRRVPRARTRAVQLARDTGALALLPVALVHLSGVHPVRRESSPRPRRLSRRRTRSRRRPATHPDVRLGCCSPPGAASKPKPCELIDAGEARGDARGARAWGWASRRGHRGAQQRLWPLRGGHGRRQARSDDGDSGYSGVGAARARRGGDPLRRRRSSPPPRWTGSASGPGAAARIGRSGSRPAHAR